MPVDLIVASPPYAESLNDGKVDDRWRAWSRNPGGSNRLSRSAGQSYGHTAGQLGGMKPGTPLPPGDTMPLPVTEWTGCYDDGWKGLMGSPEAFAHPAKFARGLIRRIYQHALQQGWLAPGSTVLDPFGGIALGALDAILAGCHWVGVELEPRFFRMAAGHHCPGDRGTVDDLCPRCWDQGMKEYNTPTLPPWGPHYYEGNIDAWHRKRLPGNGSAQILQGDSRELIRIIDENLFCTCDDEGPK